MAQCGFEIFPYCIDWQATGAMLGGIAAIVAVISGFLAASRWMDQELFSKDRVVAMDALAIWYEGREIINVIRSPIIIDVETAEAERALGEQANQLDEEDLEVRRFSLIFRNRIYFYRDYFDRLISLKARVKAHFSEDVHNSLIEILVIRRELEAAAKSYVDTGGEGAHAIDCRRKLRGQDGGAIESRLNEKEAILEARFKRYKAGLIRQTISAGTSMDSQ